MNREPLLDAVFPTPDALPGALRAARRRRRVRHTLAVSPVFLAGVAAALVALRPPADTHTGHTNRPDPTPAIPAISVVRSAVATPVRTRTSTFHVVHTTPLPVPRITDDHLLELASSPGRPAAIVHHHGSPRLVSAHTP